MQRGKGDGQENSSTAFSELPDQPNPTIRRRVVATCSAATTVDLVSALPSLSWVLSDHE